MSRSSGWLRKDLQAEFGYRADRAVPCSGDDPGGGGQSQIVAAVHRNNASEVADFFNE